MSPGLCVKAPSRLSVLLLAVLLVWGLYPFALLAEPGVANDPVKQAFEQLYRFHFSAAHQTLDDASRAAPEDPLPHVARSAVYLFSELERLGILASEFFQDRGERLRGQDFTADPAIRDQLRGSVEQARRLAEQRLRQDAHDADAMFALAMAAGIECNYTVFVEKKRLAALSLAKRSHEHTLRLLESQPAYEDARVVTGTNEYLVASLPFFVRWFVRFREIEGSKQKAVGELEQVARSGKYFMSFAKILLVAIHLREHRPNEARKLLDDLVKRYPENPLFRRELTRLDSRAARGAN